MKETERGLLGCILIEPSCLNDIYDRLKPEMFVDEFCGAAYKEMLILYDCGKKINIMELSVAMESHKYDKNLIRKYLKECIDSTPYSILVKSYADAIIKAYKARIVKELFSHASFLPKEIEHTIADCISRLESLQKSETYGLRTIKEIVEQNREDYFTKHRITSGIQFGFSRLHECLGDLQKGDVTVLAARPSVGKSAFVLQAVRDFCRNGLKVGYFNLEMREQQVYERLVSNISGLSLIRVKRADAFRSDEEEKFVRANDELAKYKLYISSSRNTTKIKAECRYQNFDVIVVDHLQLTQSDRKWNGNRSSEIGENSREFKSLAMSLGAHVILVSQLNRMVEYRESKEPMLSDLRESGDIEQDASNVLFIWNLSDDEKYRAYKGVKTEKNRDGVLMKAGFLFDGEHMQFQESKKSFEDFSLALKRMENGNDFGNANEPDILFGQDW